MVWYGINMWALYSLTSTTKSKNIPWSVGVNTNTKASGVLGLALMKTLDSIVKDFSPSKNWNGMKWYEMPWNGMVWWEYVRIMYFNHNQQSQKHS